MKGFEVILENITLLSAMMAVGFICVKSGYISGEVKNALSKIIVRVTLPLLIVNALTNIELTPARAKNAALVAVLALAVVAVMYAVGALTARLWRLELPAAVIHRCMMAFGNVAFLGYPLIRAIFGDEGFFYAAVYEFVNDIFVWTFVVCKLNSIGADGKIPLKTQIKNAVNPCTIAFFVSFALMLLKIRPTGLALGLTEGIGSMTTPLSMIFIGGTLAEVRLGGLRRLGSFSAVVLIKMLAAPILLALLTRALPLSEAARGAFILQVGMPSQTILSVLTLEYGGDSVYTSEGILITTLAALITLPAVYYVLCTIG